MSSGAEPVTLDEEILMLLAEWNTASSAEVAATLGLLQRTVRRRLRRLIRDGYAFAPERGRYRTTKAGRAVMGIGDPEQ